MARTKNGSFWHMALRLLALLILLAPLSATAAEAPRRVVSMNLCTDQLAMMLAAPGQLVSVSTLATDPRISPMAEQARAYPTNRGLAEEIYLLRPDLVVTGQFTRPDTVSMLRRLDIPVVAFPSALSLDDVRDNLALMGRALGREQAAAEMIADFDAQRAALPPAPIHRPRAAMFEANGYTAGEKTLAGQILKAAGFDNVAAELGFEYAGNLPLELLVMAAPDIVISGQPYPGASRSEAIVTHPALAALYEGRPTAQLSDHDWSCGTPFVLRAVEKLARARQAAFPEAR